MGMNKMFAVFIGHFTAEKQIGETFQNLLRKAFGDDLKVFRSSDIRSPTCR